MASTMARVDRVSKTYRLGATAVSALRSVSVAVAAGEFVAIAGPSGSGKTTLLNLIGCLDRPDRGTVEVGGAVVSTLPARKLSAIRRDQLGYIFQSFNLVPVLTAFENVEYPLLLSGTHATARRSRVLDLLDRVGLREKAACRPHELSGGERQRVAIARALVNRPGLVLADEPTANLDSETGGAVLDLMDDLRRSSGAAFLFASHDPRLLDRMDRVVLLRDGEVADERAPSPHSMREMALAAGGRA